MWCPRETIAQSLLLAIYVALLKVLYMAQLEDPSNYWPTFNTTTTTSYFPVSQPPQHQGLKNEVAKFNPVIIIFVILYVNGSFLLWHIQIFKWPLDSPRVFTTVLAKTHWAQYLTIYLYSIGCSCVWNIILHSSKSVRLRKLKFNAVLKRALNTYFCQTIMVLV